MARRPRKQPTSVKNNYAQLSHTLATAQRCNAFFATKSRQNNADFFLS
jgi:hypothetical protein